MTRLEIIRENKKHYEDLMTRIPSMKGLEKAVAENIITAWLIGSDKRFKFLGGLGCGKYSERAFDRAMAQGYSFEEVYNEFMRQMDQYIEQEGR